MLAAGFWLQAGALPAHYNDFPLGQAVALTNGHLLAAVMTGPGALYDSVTNTGRVARCVRPVAVAGCIGPIILTCPGVHAFRDCSWLPRHPRQR